jgi:deoxyadenosine/deoxycytidine kinase
MIYIFSVEGNIGSGKSTLLKELSKNVKNINKINVVYLQEPVDTWDVIRDSTTNETILEKFYKDPNKYAFPFQMLAFITRVNQINKIISDNTSNDVIIITERCVFTDREVFAKMLFDTGNIEQICYDIYLKWFDEFTKLIRIDGYIYLTTNPDICNIHILKRSREGENNINIDYLKSCHEYHRKWLENKKELLEINDDNYQKEIINFISNLL